MKSNSAGKSVTFVHTADWQLGKPFAFVKDPAKRVSLQAIRVEAIRRIGELARSENAQFIVVAGDSFDSPRATKATIADACSAIGSIGLPVVMIPGNHDHAGEGCLWDQPFFRKECEQLAPNLRVLTTFEPLELDDAVILPCPLQRRHESYDPTHWLRAFDGQASGFCDKVRIVLAHGSVLSFGRDAADDDNGTLNNLIDIDSLSLNEFDYVALGDWHGTKQISAKVWYSGTPEADRYPKSAESRAGNVLIVQASRNETPDVKAMKVGQVDWNDLDLPLTDDSSVSQFEMQLKQLLNTVPGRNVLRLKLRGQLGLDACTALESKLESLEARLLHLELTSDIQPVPTDDELVLLAKRPDDPLIARVASQLIEMISTSDPQSDVASCALRKLYSRCQ